MRIIEQTEDQAFADAAFSAGSMLKGFSEAVERYLNCSCIVCEDMLKWYITNAQETGERLMTQAFERKQPLSERVKLSMTDRLKRLRRS